MDNAFFLATISPILITVGGIITWFLKSRQESLQLVEQRAREKQLETYKKILDPYIIILTPTAKDSEKKKALDTILTVDYKKASFDLITFGSDETVRSYNKIMQAFFKLPNQSEKEDWDILINFANLLLNIRKDLYSKTTTLKRSETLEFFITDIEKHRNIFDRKK